MTRYLSLEREETGKDTKGREGYGWKGRIRKEGKNTKGREGYERREDRKRAAGNGAGDLTFKPCVNF